MPLSISTSGIAQEAFRLIELDPASSLAEGTDKANAAADAYPLALQECLERCDWSFASTYVELAVASLPLNVSADPNLPYFYTLPGDCLALREVGDFNTHWRRDAVGLRADDPAPLPVRYTAHQDSEAKMPATFRFLVSLNLAIRLAPLFQTNSTKLEQLRDMERGKWQAATRQDGLTASQARYDDLTDAQDWVAQATL